MKPLGPEDDDARTRRHALISAIIAIILALSCYFLFSRH